MSAFLSNKEVARELIDILRAGKMNSEQEAMCKQLEVKLGVRDDSCQHDMDSTCDADNVFHCIGCGAVVSQP